MSQDIDELLKEAPTLTFDTVAPHAPETPVVVEEKKAQIAEVQLTEEEQRMVDNFAAQIDLSNTQMILQYGSGSQKKIADFSETALDNVRAKDLGEVGQLLTGVVAQLRSFDEEEEKGIWSVQCARYGKGQSGENFILGERSDCVHIARHWTGVRHGFCKARRACHDICNQGGE